MVHAGEGPGVRGVSQANVSSINHPFRHPRFIGITKRFPFRRLLVFVIVERHRPLLTASASFLLPPHSLSYEVIGNHRFRHVSPLPRSLCLALEIDQGTGQESQICLRLDCIHQNGTSACISILLLTPSVTTRFQDARADQNTRMGDGD